MDCHDGSHDVASSRALATGHAANKHRLTVMIAWSFSLGLVACLDRVQCLRRNSTGRTVLYRTRITHGGTDTSSSAWCISYHGRHFSDDSSKRQVPDSLPITNRFFFNVVARWLVWCRQNGRPAWCALCRLLLGTNDPCLRRRGNEHILDARRYSLCLN